MTSRVLFYFLFQLGCLFQPTLNAAVLTPEAQCDKLMRSIEVKAFDSTGNNLTVMAKLLPVNGFANSLHILIPEIHDFDFVYALTDAAMEDIVDLLEKLRHRYPEDVDLRDLDLRRKGVKASVFAQIWMPWLHAIRLYYVKWHLQHYTNISHSTCDRPSDELLCYTWAEHAQLLEHNCTISEEIILTQNWKKTSGDEIMQVDLGMQNFMPVGDNITTSPLNYLVEVLFALYYSEGLLQHAKKIVEHMCDNNPLKCIIFPFSRFKLSHSMMKKRVQDYIDTIRTFRDRFAKKLPDAMISLKVFDPSYTFLDARLMNRETNETNFLVLLPALKTILIPQ